MFEMSRPSPGFDAANPNRYVVTLLTVAPTYPAGESEDNATLICSVPSTLTMNRGFESPVGDTSTSTVCIDADRGEPAAHVIELAADPAM